MCIYIYISVYIYIYIYIYTYIYIYIHTHTHNAGRIQLFSDAMSVCMCVHQHFEGTFLWHSMTQCHITQDINYQKQQQHNIKHCKFNKRPGGNIENLSCIIIYK